MAAHLARGLAYGIYPSVYSVQVMGRDLDRYRHLYRQYVPAIEELSAAGWEPVPYASVSGSGEPSHEVIVERFGSFADGELHFTLRNYTDQPVTAALQLDRKGLGVPANAELVVQDTLPRSPQFTPLAAVGQRVDLAPQGSAALWVGTREQAARHGLRLATRTLERLERLFATEMTGPGKAAWEQAVKLAREGEAAKPERLLPLAQELQTALNGLPEAMSTKSPVDLTKLVLRARVEASYVPAALLGLQVSGLTPAGPAARGDVLTLTGRLAGLPTLTESLSGFVMTPWSGFPSGTTVAWDATATGTKEAGFAAKIPTPANPPRASLAYVLALKGATKSGPFTVCLPYEHVVGDTLKVTGLPERLFRGQERRVTLTFANQSGQAGTVTVKLGPVRLVGLKPEQFTLDLPAQGQAEQTVTLTLDKNVSIGDLRLPYAVTSTDPRFITSGTVLFSVGDPVPQVTLRRAPTPPVIDGKLDDAVWQQAPLVPELRKLVGGGEATEKTTVWAAYDDRGLYVAFRCRESQMSKLVARFTERGSPLYQEDDVEVFVIPPRATQTYQFAINALGTRSDNSGNQADWQAAATRGAGEWTVEAFLPFAAVGVTASPVGGLPWGMQFGRQQKAKGETTSWTPGTAFIVKESMGEVAFE